jgi:hypothetical protein
MTNRFSILCCVIGVLQGATACGASDKHRHVLADSGADSGSGGGSTGGASGTGGASSGGATGSGGKSAIKDASTDGSTVADAAPEASTPTADAGRYACPALPSDAGDAKISQWRDYSTGVCRACPATPVGCQELLGAPGPKYDPVTRVLTLYVKPGYAEVVSSTSQWNYYYKLSDGGNAAGNATVVGIAPGDRVIFDLSKVAPPGTYSLRNTGFTTVDACGYTTPDTGDYMTVDLIPNPDGGAPLVNIVCWAS